MKVKLPIQIEIMKYLVDLAKSKREYPFVVRESNANGDFFSRYNFNTVRATGRLTPSGRCCYSPASGEEYFRGN